MKLAIFFTIFTVALAAVLAEPEPYDGYSNQRKNVRVIVEKRIPVVQKIVEVRRQQPRRIVVVKESYNSKSGSGGYGGGYGGYGSGYGSG